MKTSLKIIIGFISIIGLAYLSFSILVHFGGLTDSNCNEEHKRVYSPTKKYAVYYSQEICAPENILKARVIVHDKGMKNANSVFKATSKKPNLELDFNWENDNNLVIKYPKGTNVTYTYNTTGEKIVNVIFREKNR